MFGPTATCNDNVVWSGCEENYFLHKRTGTVTIQHGDYVRIAVPPFDEPSIPTHFAVRACQAGLTRGQLLHQFQRFGELEDDLFTDIEAAQHQPRAALPPAATDAEDDAVQLHQVAVVLKKASLTSQRLDDALVTCNAEEHLLEPARFERSIPGTHLPPTGLPGTTPPSWLAAMPQALMDSAAVEHEEEGPVGYVDTWFLAGHRAYTTEESRVFRADQFSHHWHEDIVDLWRDKVDLARPLHFHWVTPTPKAFDHQRTHRTPYSATRPCSQAGANCRYN